MYKNRYWFLRFLEGTDGANAGGAPDAGAGEKSGETPGDAGGAQEVDWEARAKELETDRDKWKGFARTWEDRAKDNEAAAKRLKAEEDAGKSDVQRLEEQLADLREAAAKREADLAAKERKALIVTIAAEEGVAKDDIEFLPDSDDEDVVRKFAKRLAAGSGQGAESNNFGGSTGSSKESVINRVKSL